MSAILYDWAIRWGVPPAAITDLIKSLIVSGGSNGYNKDEREVSALVRLEASQKDVLLWRNNVGVLVDQRGVPVRYGLCNESERVNKQLKSADLIGLRRTGQFVAREVKRPGWKYTGTPREQAQLNFVVLVQAYNGDACFTDCEGSL